MIMILKGIALTIENKYKISQNTQRSMNSDCLELFNEY